MNAYALGTNPTLDDVLSVASGRPVRLPAIGRARVKAARARLERIVATGESVYGVNTGFGELASRRIPPASIRELQYNLLRSHASGVGEPLSPEISRAILFLRANELAKGHSGCRVELVEALIAILNRGLSPMIPSRGSVGASGDLAPQAHAALLVIGEGEARLRRGASWSRPMRAAAALSAARLKPLALEAKEGLSLINGTQAMQSVSSFALRKALRALNAANLAGAMSLEAIKGTPVPFEEAISRLKPHPGQRKIAARLRELLHDSEIRRSHLRDDPRVQDPYSFRCMPQVHGAASDALDFSLRILLSEMSSVTDNPIVAGSQVISGGNFHGQALSLACDTAAIALATLGGISERRIAQLISGAHGLKLFLAPDPGLQSGFMIPQVAAAALASEGKTLAHPASADSIPTSAEKEDFVSMGMGAALKLDRAAENAAQIVAIELVAAAQAVEFHRPLKPGAGVLEGLRRLRARVRRLEGDEPFYERLAVAKDMILRGDFDTI